MEARPETTLLIGAHWVLATVLRAEHLPTPQTKQPEGSRQPAWPGQAPAALWDSNLVPGTGTSVLSHSVEENVPLIDLLVQ